MKQCVVCREVKDLSAFYGHKTSADGHGYRCKVCDGAARRKSRNGPGGQKTRDRMRERKLVDKYGITLKEYEAMLVAQDNRCAICKTDNPYGEGQIHQRARMSFAVDHCHKTGKTRSLLCNLCNRALGFLQDDPEIVKAAWVYLEAHKAGCH